MSFFDYSSVYNYPIFLEECKSEGANRLFGDTIDKYHSYVKHVTPPQRRINYNIYETQSGNHIGSVGISSCVLAIGSRDNWIGWDKDTRLHNSNSVCNNYRFCLIQPNITIKNVGTMVLKTLREEAVKRWESKYGDPLALMETFVQPDIENSTNKRNGAVYLADNWHMVGMTQGNSISKAPVLLWQKEDSKRGELARLNPEEAIKKYAVGNNHYVITESPKKLVFVKPLRKDWKKILLAPALVTQSVQSVE
jgi:hypothetical protein